MNAIFKEDKISLDELFHYGVLGMKWGVQKDKKSGVFKKLKNTLKSLSSKTQNKTENDKENTEEKELEISNLFKGVSQKKLRLSSEKDLKIVIDRLQMERQYKSLTAKETSRGKALIDASKRILKDVSVTIATAVVSFAIKNQFQKHLPPHVYTAMFPKKK